MEEDLHDYLRLLLAKDAGLIFLCVCGVILNGAMLYMLIFRKQVRTSVHTVYMIQIALTDLLVCVVWLALTCIVTNNLLKNSAPPPDYESNDTAGKEINGSVSPDFSEILVDDSTSQYRLWRIMYSWYNFHYYTNIFLLSSMSVERCAAVWKSMRCQRYQYNRKAIYSVSALMWLLALAFVLPNFINPDMIVSESDSAPNFRRALDTTEVPPVNSQDWKESADPLSRVFQGRSTETNDLPKAEASVSGKPHLSDGFAIPEPCSKQHNDQKAYDEENKVYKSDLDILFECYTLLVHARKNNRDSVQDYNSIVLEDCLMDIAFIAQDYNYESTDDIDDAGYPAYSTDYGDIDENELESYFEGMYEDELTKNNNKSPLTETDITYDPENDIYPWGYNKTTSKLHKVRSDLYQELLTDAVHRLIARHQDQALDCVCDPHLSTVARVYILVINLILGFFIPFCIIVVSYVSIAYMIGKRARSRMNPYANAEASTTQYGHYYQANPSTTNIPLANITHGRERSVRRTSEYMGRRMSDMMKNLILRKNNPEAENRSYWSESERECSPYGSMQKMPLTSSSKHHDYSGNNTTPKSGRKGLGNGKIMERIRNRLEKHRKGNRHDKPGEMSAGREESNELMGQPNENRKENSEIKKVSPQRVKKHSFGYDATNENIPQTIEEHPHEAEDAEFNVYYDKEYRGTCNFIDEKPPSFIRGHHQILLQIQNNSRRESGGSYGSSIESMATDQTSLLTSLGHDKRLSATTTISALTPPTPAHPGNPNANAFFPPHDEKIIYNRSQSAEPGYPTSSGTETQENQQTTSNDQRSPRPGSQLNDVTFKLFQKSMMKKTEMNENECKFSDYEIPTDGESSSSPKCSKTPIRSNISRSISAPEERMLTIGRPSTRPSKSSSRIAYDTNRSSNGDSGEIQQPVQSSSLYPKYHRQNSSTSTVFFTRGRTYSTTSNRSMLGSNNTLRKTMARKNAERHLRVSHTVLAYVIVFAICWLPQRIVYLLYVTESLMGATAPVCIKLIVSTRIVSFISVLLNPIVYIVSQRDIRAYLRKSLCVTKLRQWCSKLTRKQVVLEERRFVGESGTNPTLGRHDHHIELRQRPDLNDKEDSSNGKGANAARAPVWTPSPQRPVSHHRRNSGDFFAAAATRRRDATINEMKEEEAAAEESLEKEMERLAKEATKSENDEINKNWFHMSDENAISDKHSGSGNKSCSSGSKSDSSKGENIEEFWMRWLRNGGADFLSPTSDEMPTDEVPRDLESSMAELDNIVRSRIAADPNNEMGETII